MNENDSSPASLALLDKNGSTSTVWQLKEKNSFYIGRSKNNDISLPFTWISRQHAMIQVEENGAYNIVDLGSSNGTMVNGRRRHSATRLYSGDKLQIGSDKTTLVFFQDYTPEVSDDQDDLEEETVAFLQTELVTILVCDIRKFTSLSEIIGAELVSGILTAWSKNVNDLVQKHNGSIDKFIGDAVMATWAAKESQMENILAAMRTLLAIREMTVLLSAKLPNLPWPMEVGGAINIGEAVTGNIGVDGGRDYTVVGDVVNVTFRLEEMTTKAGMDILLGPNVSGYLPHFKDFFTTCKYLVKGKKEPITAYGGSFDKLRIYLQQCQER